MLKSTINSRDEINRWNIKLITGYTKEFIIESIFRIIRFAIKSTGRQKKKLIKITVCIL